MTDCIFCAIVAGQATSHPVYEDEHCLAFLDVNPLTRGHTLVVPRRHAADLLALSEDDAQHVMRATHRVAFLLEARLQPAGINLVQANRAAAMQTVFHMHMHVVPRYEGDGLMPASQGWRPRAAEAHDLAALREVIAIQP